MDYKPRVLEFFKLEGMDFIHKKTWPGRNDRPPGGTQNIATQEQMGHNEGIFLTKPENSLWIPKSGWDITREFF
jgi:hypothetical protein